MYYVLWDSSVDVNLASESDHTPAIDTMRRYQYGLGSTYWHILVLVLHTNPVRIEDGVGVPQLCFLSRTELFGSH